MESVVLWCQPPECIVSEEVCFQPKFQDLKKTAQRGGAKVAKELFLPSLFKCLKSSFDTPPEG